MAKAKKTSSIRKKIFSNMMIVVGLITIMGALALIVVHMLYANSNSIYTTNVQSLSLLRNIHHNISEIDQYVVGLTSSLDDDYHDEYIESIHTLQQDNIEYFSRYSMMKLSEEDLMYMSKLQDELETYNNSVNKIVDEVTYKKTSLVIQDYKDNIIPTKEILHTTLEEMERMSTENIEYKNQQNFRIFLAMSCSIVFFFVLAILISVIVSFRLNTYFSDRLYTIRKYAKRISEYNVADDIHDVANDEFGETIAALNDSQMMMRDLLEKIINESATINDTGEEVSLAVRKSTQRIETANVKVFNAESGCHDIHEMIIRILEDRELSDDVVLHLRELLATANENQSLLKSTQTELTSISMYLEQIGITMDYQNEIANEHREQVQKFKV